LEIKEKFNVFYLSFLRPQKDTMQHCPSIFKRSK